MKHPAFFGFMFFVIVIAVLGLVVHMIGPKEEAECKPSWPNVVEYKHGIKYGEKP